jgi:hypothetical protein
MSFHRANITGPDRLVQQSRAGDGLTANFIIKAYAAEADATLTLADINGGFIHQGTTLTSDVTYTLPTAAILAAAWTNMDIGDTYPFMVNNSQVGAFDVVIAVGTGITAVGANNTLSTPPQSTRTYVLKKTAAATFDLY